MGRGPAEGGHLEGLADDADRAAPLGGAPTPWADRSAAVLRYHAPAEIRQNIIRQTYAIFAE
jgi:hypothetical protein